MTDVGAPRPAATVIVVRDRPGSTYEVLMLLRNLRSDFVGGAYVFPGGGVDPHDSSDEAAARCRDLDDARASSLLGLDEGGLSYWIACARELFEEAGLLLATREDGGAIDMSDPAMTARFEVHRREVNDGASRFIDVLAREHLMLDTKAMCYFAHWITPVGPPRRYDTRFFVAAAPADQVPVHDDKELVANTWVTPAEALDKHARGEMQLILPTIKNLEAIQRFDSSAALLDAAGRATAVPTIEPRIVADGTGVRILLPGDGGYDDHGPNTTDVAAGTVANKDITAATREAQGT